METVLIRIVFVIQHIGSMSFDIRLIHHHKSVPVAKLIKIRSIWIMAGTNGIKIMLFHQGKIFKDVFFADRKTGYRVKIMAVYPVKLNLLSVKKNHPVLDG